MGRLEERREASNEGRDHPTFQIAIPGLGRTIICRVDQSILAAIIASGTKSIAVGCRSGGCGVCRIKILKGTYRTGYVNRAIVGVAEEREHIALSCRAFPTSDCSIEPLPLKHDSTRALRGEAA